ncbi:hypothetical protein D3C72_2126870 [compost metagenome]
MPVLSGFDSRRLVAFEHHGLALGSGLQIVIGRYVGRIQASELESLQQLPFFIQQQ